MTRIRAPQMIRRGPDTQLQDTFVACQRKPAESIALDIQPCTTIISLVPVTGYNIHIYIYVLYIYLAY